MPFDCLYPTPDTGKIPLTVEILIDARRLVEQRTGWIKGKFKVGPRFFFQKQTRYCMAGALREVGDEREITTALSLLNSVARAGGHRNIIDFNDDSRTTHHDVVNAFNKAIALASSNLQPN